MKERRHLKELSVDRKILEGIGWTWCGLIWLKVGQGPECCEHGNEASGSIKLAGNVLAVWTSSNFAGKIRLYRIVCIVM